VHVWLLLSCSLLLCVKKAVLLHRRGRGLCHGPSKEAARSTQPHTRLAQVLGLVVLLLQVIAVGLSVVDDLVERPAAGRLVAGDFANGPLLESDATGGDFQPPLQVDKVGCGYNRFGWVHLERGAGVVGVFEDPLVGKGGAIARFDLDNLL